MNARASGPGPLGRGCGKLVFLVSQCRVLWTDDKGTASLPVRSGVKKLSSSPLLRTLICNLRGFVFRFCVCLVRHLPRTTPMANRSSGGGPDSSNSWRSGARVAEKTGSPAKRFSLNSPDAVLVLYVGCEPALLEGLPYELERMWGNIW